MKLILRVFLFLLVIPASYAEEQGGLKEVVAPPSPDKIEDGYRGTEDARVMTVKFAKTMHDGATLSLRGNLIHHKGGDRYIFRDGTDEIETNIPKSVFDGREVKPDQMISINGTLDKKAQPLVMNVDRLQK
ncbi:YdeI family stress tolerance OB fold protein [Buttiauxella sp.]|uniref:YdeI family stress tolerance OB fold protein n=1 Tax=Buttiauxella sp. TaxID=1972222 RepID=UPI003C746DFC